MTNYGRDLQFGWFLDPSDNPATLIAAARAAARAADRAGMDLIGIQDHPYNSGHLDTWTLLSALGAATERVTLFPDVANLPLRGSAMLAKAAATLDLITGGRVELGIGSGAFWDAMVAMGATRRTPAESLRATEEAIDVIRLWWSGERAVSYPGEFYPIKGAHPGPAPAHDMGIWLGALGPKMLELTGRKGDGWLPSLSYMPPEKLADAHARIDEGARAAGRDPASINRIYNLWGNYPVNQWVDQLTAFTLQYGMNSYIFGGPPVESELRRITDEIAPAVREAVTRERGL